MRVVSLVPSVTETLLAWGVVPVAVTRFCEQPTVPTLQTLPTVGGTKDPDVAAIVALQPDLVVVNDEENRREDADALEGAGLAVHVTHVERVADVAPCLDALAAAVRVAAPTAHPLPPARPVTRRAFVPIWRRPWMTCNAATYGSSVLEQLGIGNVFAGAATRYPVVDLADAAARRPDLVLLPTEPYPFADRHRGEMATTVADDVRIVDGQDLFWWGVRTPVALERLAQVLAQVRGS